jgi:hypothetical protein
MTTLASTVGTSDRVFRVDAALPHAQVAYPMYYIVEVRNGL